MEKYLKLQEEQQKEECHCEECEEHEEPYISEEMLEEINRVKKISVELNKCLNDALKRLTPIGGSNIKQITAELPLTNVQWKEIEDGAKILINQIHVCYIIMNIDKMLFERKMHSIIEDISYNATMKEIKKCLRKPRRKKNE